MSDPEDAGAPTRLSLDDILDQDVEGLLDAPEKPKKITSSDRLERAFLEIVEFRRINGRVPSSTTRQIAERKLGARLDGILANEQKIEALKHLDEFGLLEAQQPPASLEELLDGDALDNLLSDDEGILDVSDLPTLKRPESPESVARRVKAQDFEQFEPLFKTKHGELADGTLHLAAFTGLDLIREGAFFVLGGLLCFVAEVGDDEGATDGSKRKQRLRVVFENGTESRMYKRSLMTRMYEQQGQILARSGIDASEILDGDVESGHIYVLRSLSTDPQIARIRNLHKIGYSTTSVQKRTSNAANDPTYLMAPVEIIEDYRTYNLKPSALEHLLHRVFAEARLNLTQIDAQGRAYDPREWFVVPRTVINQAIQMIISGDITDYTYDTQLEKLTEHNPAPSR